MSDAAVRSSIDESDELSSITTRTMATRLQQIAGNAICFGKMCPLKAVFTFVIGMTIGEFLGQNELEARQSTYMAYALLVVHNKNCGVVVANRPPVIMTEPSDFVESFLNPACHWYMSLVGCYQTGGLKDTNISSFFKSCGTEVEPARAMQLIAYMASTGPDIKGSNEFLSIMEADTFTTYHGTASTTPKLILGCIADSPFTNINLFSTEEIDAVEAAVAAPTDLSLAQRIPDRAIITAHAMLTANGVCPSNWWSADRVVKRYSPSRYAALVAMFKRAYAVSTDVGDLNELKTLRSIEEKFATLGFSV